MTEVVVNFRADFLFGEVVVQDEGADCVFDCLGCHGGEGFGDEFAESAGALGGGGVDVGEEAERKGLFFPEPFVVGCWEGGVVPFVSL